MVFQGCSAKLVSKPKAKCQTHCPTSWQNVEVFLAEALSILSPAEYLYLSSTCNHFRRQNHCNSRTKIVPNAGRATTPRFPRGVSLRERGRASSLESTCTAGREASPCDPDSATFLSTWLAAPQDSPLRIPGCSWIVPLFSPCHPQVTRTFLFLWHHF